SLFAIHCVDVAQEVVRIGLGIREANIIIHRIREVIILESHRNVGPGRIISDRVDRGIGRASNGIPIAARSHHGYHQPEVVVPAPTAESLAEIGVGMRNVELTGYIQEATETKSAVAKESK